MKITGIIVILLLTNHSGQCAKILGLFACPGRSHHILGTALMKELAERGHDVTAVSAFPEKNLPKNGTYRQIVVSEILDKWKKMQSEEKTTMFDRQGANPFLMAAFFGIVMPGLFGETLKNKEIQDLIHSEEKFDLVIVEEFLNDAQKALSTHFKAPLVVLSTMSINNWVNSIVGNPAPPSYIPDMLSEYTNLQLFSERLLNSLLYVFDRIFWSLIVWPNQNTLIKKYIPNGPEIYDVLYNASIVLMNSHPSLNQPVPFVPNMIDIGGFHVKPSKTLPKDLQEYLDSAKNGVIYFSMGSNLKSSELPLEKREAILKTFSKLKQKVLWKWEEDSLPGQPPNVKTGKWLPQQDILAHPNVKLFITHGGLLSTTETVHHGVPLLAIPIFGDQAVNAKTAVSKGYGLMLPYTEISEETFTNKLQELLNNPKYSKTAKKTSELFHDRLVSPMDTAMYWIEYVIRHKGAPHLRVAGVDLPWYKYHLVDVISFLVLVSLSLVVIFCYVVKFVCKKVCPKKETKKVKTK